MIGFRLKRETGVIRIARTVFYIAGGVFLLFHLFFAAGLTLVLPGRLKYYAAALLVCCLLMLLSLIAVRLRYYTAATVMMTVAAVAIITIGFILRNPPRNADNFTFDAITKWNLVSAFFPVTVPLVASYVLLIPSVRARRDQITADETKYENIYS